jgi:beta-glucanase (GH16 family)
MFFNVGTWPAMWLLSQNGCWAIGAEVDIAEFIGKSPTDMGQYYHYSSQCCAIYGSCISSQGQQVSTGANYPSGYHIYAFEWFPQNMTWYIDGVKTVSFKTSTLTVTPDASPHYWIINLAMGGGYPGPVSSSSVPATLKVDYVKNYVWRVSCSGETCSGHGQCNPTTFLCVCNPGYVGASCEQYVGSWSTSFTANINLFEIPNGWGYAPYTMFNQNNVFFSSSGLKLSISNAGCPGSCYSGQYSGGGWESWQRFGYGTFTFQAKSTNVAGTGFSLSASGESALLEQCAFAFLGNSPRQVSILTTTSNYEYNNTVINVNFDTSAAYHLYAFKYFPAYTLWYIDNVLVYNSSVVQPKAIRLAPGAFYAYQPVWYGPFTTSYNGPYYTYVQSFNWQMNV